MGWASRGSGTPVVVKMENPSWSVLELEGLGPAPGSGPGSTRRPKGRSTRQLMWVLLLKVIHLRHNGTRKDKLLGVIKGFLAAAVLMLCLEFAAHLGGWRFGAPPELRIGSLPSFFHQLYLAWLSARACYLAPPLQALINACIALFLLQSLDRILQCLACIWIRYHRIEPVPPDIEEAAGTCRYPMVLVQVPMCNEKTVYQQSIASMAQLDWPGDRILIQVLDDSDDEEVEALIKEEVRKWRNKGISIEYLHRTPRTGYKAGNLKAAMAHPYVKDYEFVAIFDADFQPQPDFLKRTIVHFQGNDELGLVQTRWSFINKDENLLTRLQYINLSYHFEVEQQVNGVFLNFFGFNGTAGVWRIKALEGSGGWLERTTVEDMDIAVRAHLNGWKFIFLNDVKCLCELPECYGAYRKQQHRWHSGPMQLFRLCLPDIIASKISIWKKGNLIFLFFLLRKLILPFYSFTLFCIILPMTMFIPEAHLPTWVVCYIPALMSILNVLPAPKSFPFLVPFLLFENTMSVTKFNAMISGLFQLGSAYEWVVTKKVGRSSDDLVKESDLGSLVGKPKQTEVRRRKKVVYRNELALALLLLTAAARSLLSVGGVHFYFLLFQGISFLVVGLDLIGEQLT